MAAYKDIIGHEHIIEYLQNCMKENKVSHAYIFNGEQGSGKKLLADAFSAALQCEKKGISPCGECTSCKQAYGHNHPDIIWLTHEKPNSIGVDDIREGLNNDIAIKPYKGPFKIYIVDEAEKMTIQAQNALLKTIEEPPAYGIILLLTTNEKMMLPTILSRCVSLSLRPVKDNLIKEFLMKQYEIPDYQADISVAFAQGNVGKAIRLATNEEFNKIKDAAIQLMKYLEEMQIYEIIDAVKHIADYKMSVNDYLDIIMIWYRDVLLFKATRDANSLIFKNEINYINKFADKSSYQNIEAIIHAIEKTKVRLNANVNFDLAMELLLLTIKEN